MTPLQVMKQALEALEALGYGYDAARCTSAFETIQKAQADLTNAIAEMEKPLSERDQPDLVWLYTHCCAIGMTCKSNSGKISHDIALFTANQATKLAEMEKAEPVGMWFQTAGGSYPRLQWVKGYVAEIGQKLYTHPQQQQTIPEGWMLVPKEPTRDMISLGLRSYHNSLERIEHLYKAMLAAAPKPEDKP